MRRLAVLSAIALIVLAALAPAAFAGEGSELRGKWSGTLEGSVAGAEQLTVKVNAAETRGSWSTSATCHGKLVLQSISNGYHHYERIAAKGVAAGCNAGGVDCLKPTEEAGQILDVYVAANGEESSGTFTRDR